MLASGGDRQYQRYNITGVITHKGPNIGEGHYIAYVNVAGSWFQCNDSYVQEVSWETVKTMRVYLLFYLRL